MCRKTGLERKRRCGWVCAEPEVTGRLVWARKGVGLDTCPVSYITAESQSLLEEFLVRRRLRQFAIQELSARQVEAFVVLERELETEMNDDEQHTRQTI